MDIKEVRTPSSGLMLWYTGYDRNIFFSISGIKKSHWTSRPLCLPQKKQENKSCTKSNRQTNYGVSKKYFESLLTDILFDELTELIELDYNKNSMWSHVFWRSKGQKLYKRNLHCQKSTKDIENVVSRDYFIEFFSLFRLVGDEVEQNKNRNNIYNERVTSPRSNHIKIR